jgi:hypothetical protein
MSSRSRTRACRRGRWLAAAAMLAAMLSACSDIYYDRRETISLGAGDAIASNTVAQMIDPWPVYVGNKDLAFNGERMQSAVECYRHNPRVIVPVNPNTTAVVQQLQQNAAGTTCPPMQAVPAAPPAAPVK